MSEALSAIRKLPVKKTIIRSHQLVFKNPIFRIKNVWGFLGIWTLFLAFQSSGGLNNKNSNLENWKSVLSLLESVLSINVGVVWTRYLLLSEKPDLLIIYRNSFRAFYKPLIILFLFFLITSILFVIISVISSVIFHISFSDKGIIHNFYNIIFIIIFIEVLYVFVTYSLVIVSISINTRLSFKEAIIIARGNWLRYFFCLSCCALPSILILTVVRHYIVFDLKPVMHTELYADVIDGSISSVVLMICNLLCASCASIAYNFFTKPRSKVLPSA